MTIENLLQSRVRLINDDDSIDDVDYATEFPLDPAIPSTCSRCNANYTETEFLALAVPQGTKPEWHYPSSNVTLAIRRCGTDGCNNTLARRIA